MTKVLCHSGIFLILFFFQQDLCSGQVNGITVTKAGFSSDMFDEFSPVHFQNGLVFCSNHTNRLTRYSDGQNKNLFDINYVDTSEKSKNNIILFSKELSTILNDGPATFSRRFDTVYFSRNQNIDPKASKILGKKNKLGIYSAVLRDGKWTDIREFRHNIEWYNFTTPCLSPDGRRLYFASDQPGGQGGLDLYYCDLKDGYWDDPVNLGPVVNTSEDEAYPFMNDAKELFFSSEGHSSMGGKDIFATKEKESGWYNPERLDSPINSEFDDFGIVTDAMMTKGYFSSMREKTADIYSFSSENFNFWFTDYQDDNNLCFNISDNGSIDVDTTRLQYVWDFGDGSTMTGLKAQHCYSKPGPYSIKLNIIDRRTRKLFFNKLRYDIEVLKANQLFINAPATIARKKSITFDGLKSNLPGYVIAGYFWDFDDGTLASGEQVYHTYSDMGEYDVKLGVILKNDKGDRSTKVVTKKIRITDDLNTYSSSQAASFSRLAPDIFESPMIRVKNVYPERSEPGGISEFQIVIASSSHKIASTSAIFKKVPAKYNIQETFNKESGLYYYLIGQEMELMFTYQAFNEAIDAGLDASVRLYELQEPYEIDLHNLKLKYGVLTDAFFDENNRLITNGVMMLNQVVSLMIKYPQIKIEIGIHTDYQDLPAINQRLSLAKAQTMLNYLVSTGIDDKRLSVKGFGSALPIVPNTYASGRRLNRRIDFKVIK